MGRRNRSSKNIRKGQGEGPPDFGFADGESLVVNIHVPPVRREASERRSPVNRNFLIITVRYIINLKCFLILEVKRGQTRFSEEVIKIVSGCLRKSSLAPFL